MPGPRAKVDPEVLAERHREREKDRYWSDPVKSRAARRTAYHRRKGRAGTAVGSGASRIPSPEYAAAIDELKRLVEAAQAARRSPDRNSRD